MTLRVGLLHWAFPPTTGGTESHLADLARLLPSRGVETTVICGETAPEVRGSYDVVTTPLLDLTWRRAHRGDEQVLAQTIDFCRTVIESKRLDVVHGHNLHHFFPEPALALDQVRREGRVRLHHTFHETWPDILTDSPVYRHWDGNYAISAFVRDECATRIGFRPTLLTNAVDTDRFLPSPPSRAPSNPTVVLHPARLLPWKGVHLSIEMLAALVDSGRDVRLLLTDTQRIADWNDELLEYRATLIGRISELGLDDRVELRPVSFQDMPALYAEADIVVYPTIGDEPFGLVPLEAMSCGRPIVASRSGGIVESIVDGVTGRIIDRNDSAALSQGVAEFVDDPDAAARAGAAGRNHVLLNHNMTTYVDGLIERYRHAGTATAGAD